MSHQKHKTEKTSETKTAADPVAEPTEPLTEAPETPITPTPGQSTGDQVVPIPPDGDEPGSDAFELLREKAAKADANWDLYLRERAELQNYRKRATRERQDAVRYASQSLIEKLLPVLDSFEKAIEASEQAETPSLASLQEGVTLVQTQLKTVLVDIGLQEIDAGGGQVFDPNLHEAVAHHESTEVADGHVLHQVRKGYKLHDRLIRPATVVVAKAPAS